MVKVKVSLDCRIKHWFTYHPWLKLISLVLAILLWFYVSGEMSRFN